jgi:hypothetical protein
MGNTDTHLERPAGRDREIRSAGRFDGAKIRRSWLRGRPPRRAPPLGSCPPLEVHAQRRADPLCWHAAHLLRAPDALAACPWSWLLASPAGPPFYLYRARWPARPPHLCPPDRAARGESLRGRRRAAVKKKRLQVRSCCLLRAVRLVRSGRPNKFGFLRVVAPRGGQLTG